MRPVFPIFYFLHLLSAYFIVLLSNSLPDLDSQSVCKYVLNTYYVPSTEL